jgi:hypothetical protein
MTDDPVNAALQAEYLHVQKTIEDFDARALTIKAWSVTFGLVVFASAFAGHSPIPFLISAASAAIFWMLETQWKLFQVSHYARAHRIEAHFRGDAKVDHPFQISRSWYGSWKARRVGEIARIAFWPHVALPHVVLVALGLCLFALSAWGVIEP